MWIKAAKIIALASLITGAIDAIYITTSVAASGGSVAGLWKFVASGIFGSSAFSMGNEGIFLGLLFHFLIMSLFGIFIYFIYQQVAFVKKQSLLTGLIYGSCIWFIMNLVVIPLSNVEREPLKIHIDMILNLGFLVHMILGISLVYLTKKGTEIWLKA